MSTLGKIPAWAADYVGLPFERDPEKRQDCWDLARRILLERRGVELPLFETRRGMLASEDFARDQAAALKLTAVAPHEAQELDIAWFVLPRSGLHVGVVVNRWMMLHARPEETGASLERFTVQPWSRYLKGIYRCEH